MKRFYSVFLALFLLSVQSMFALGTGDVLIERVSAPHFYIETSNPASFGAAAVNTPRAAYVAFKITNVTGATLRGLRARLGTFLTVPALATAAGTLGLIGSPTSAFEFQEIGMLAPGQSDIVYWLVQYPKQATSGGSPIQCRMTITVSDPNPGTASLCEVPGITMRTIVSTGAASSTNIGGCTTTVRPVVGSINEVNVTYNYTNVAAGDEIVLQPIGNVSFLSTMAQLTNTKIISSTVPGVLTGDTDKLYYIVSGAAANVSLTVKYYFNNMASSTNPLATTLLNPYTVQAGSPGTTAIYPTNYLNAAASANFSIFNSVPFTVLKYSLNPVSTPGATVTYKITVKNNSNHLAAFQKIEDMLPKGLTYIGMLGTGTITAGLCGNLPTTGTLGTGALAFNWSGFVNNGTFPYREFVVSPHDSVTLFYQAQIPNPTGVNKLFVNTAKVYYGSYITTAASSNICVNCGDVDNDGAFDMVDEDDDNDGIQDNYEICGGCYGTNPMGDDDDDMIYNYLDANTVGYLDLNGDGVNDHWDFDMDGIINTMDKDSDNDGISDLIEGGGVDVDANGTMDIFADTDRDGVADAYDADFNTPIQTWDSDHDGNYNYLDRDSDYDGVMDISEAGYTDANGDGQLDVAVNSNGICNCVIGTNNSRVLSGVDTDGDNIPNDYLAGDTDLDGRPDYMDIDADGDGILDLLETQASSSSYVDVFNGLNTPVGSDTDHDGLDNNFEQMPTTPLNSDGSGSINASYGGYDNVPDYLDTDSDNDGILDGVEGYDSDYNGIQDILPFGFDSDQDGLDDAFDTFDLFSAIGATAQDNIIGTNATLEEDAGTGLPNRLWRTFGMPLPVILKDLKATPMSSSILVTWNTLSEINSDYFTVERSIDGNSFDALGNVTSKGGINTKTAYDFNDKKEVQEGVVTLYYRLKMVDKNGASFYSDKVSVSLPTGDLAISVFPNPAKSELNVSYYLKEASDVTLRVTNITGKEVYSTEVKGGQLLQNAKVNVSNFPTGVYFLSIKNAGASNVVKFVVE
jgi:uncharacterized repeat protein (TIGR01451 family)